MAQMKDVADGLLLLLTTLPKDSYNNVDAQHDVIYAQGKHPDEMDEQTKNSLNQLGWTWDGSVDSWRHYT